MPKKKTVSFRVGKVQAYRRAQVWYLCYHEHGHRCRPRVGPDKEAARQLAAQINAQLEVGAPAALSFRSIAIADLRDRWLEHHEQVLRSSVQTISRYRTATNHLLQFLQKRPVRHASQFHGSHAEEFARHLRTIQVAPNGHSNSAKRLLMDKGVRYILECCRAELFLREDGQAIDEGLFDCIEFRSLSQPIAQNSVVGAARGRPHAAAMRGLAGRFEKQQAGIRIERVDAPAARIAQKSIVIESGFHPEQAQTKAILPLHRAVAGARVAAELAENRDDVPAEERLRGHGRLSRQALAYSEPESRQREDHEDDEPCHERHLLNKWLEYERGRGGLITQTIPHLGVPSQRKR
jgi:hypothetical protein